MSQPPRDAERPALGRNRLAVVAFYMGIAGLLGGLAGTILPWGFCLPPLLAALVLGVLCIGAITVGPIALRRCERERRKGSVIAVAGLVAGALGLPTFLLSIALVFVGSVAYCG
jgi:hypothetical protein